MTTAIIEEAVSIPAWVGDLESFRRWAHSDDFPERGRIGYFAGRIRVDATMERIFSHNLLKPEYFHVLNGVAKDDDLGQMLTDGVLLTNADADLATAPDGMFVSWASLDAGRVELVEGKNGDYIEVRGSPDMALEIVSPSSVQKDTIILPDLYWRAGIREYWLVDARGDRARFDIFRHTARGYTPVRKTGGWLKSQVFGKSFHLAETKTARGYPSYELRVR